eukprot:5530522-Prymnesium_polylepis.1
MQIGSEAASLPHCVLHSGHMQLAAGDAPGASITFGEASEAALDAGKAKLAMKLSALSDEHAPDGEDEA